MTQKGMGILKLQHVSLIKLLVVMTVVLSLTACGKTSKDIDEYLNTGTAMDAEAKGMMPSLEALPAYKSIDYRHTQKTMFLFEANSVVILWSNMTSKPTIVKKGNWLKPTRSQTQIPLLK